jgi:chromosomal replication initiation ATPase DnaA
MNPESIIELVCSVFPCSPEAVKGHRRRRNEADARHISVALIRRYCRLSNWQMGELFGGKSASNIPHSVNRFKQLYETDKQYRAMSDKVIALCEANVAGLGS